jgi:uncharacterized damage-inducible protein DinB
MSRPEREECASFYWTYVDKVPEGDVVEILEQGLAETVQLLSGLPAELERHAYEPGKWTVREVVGHMIDAERVFGGRAHWFARGAGSELPGMDQENFAAASNAGDRPLAELVEEFRLVRLSHLAMLRGLDAAAWQRRGMASGSSVSVRALAAILAGHEIHHRGVLRDRYLAG